MPDPLENQKFCLSLEFKCRPDLNFQVDNILVTNQTENYFNNNASVIVQITPCSFNNLFNNYSIINLI